MPSSFDLACLYDEHAQALFAFLLSFTRNETDTRDLLQEGRAVPRVTVRGWDYLHKQAVSASVDAATAGTELPELKPADLARKFNSPDLVATEHSHLWKE